MIVIPDDVHSFEDSTASWDTLSSSSEEYNPEDDQDSEEDLTEDNNNECLQVNVNSINSPVKKPPQQGRSTLTLLIRNYVLSLWQLLEVKMLSSMSHTPTEVFAHNLRSRLQSLRAASPNNSSTSSAGSPASSDEEAATASSVNMPINSLSSDSLRKLLEASSVSMRSLAGTTFPPAKWAHIQAKSNKYHSETDLNCLDHLEGLKKEDARAEGLTSSKKEEDPEDRDSDLFFDFDISSPQTEMDEDEPTDIINDEHQHSEGVILPDLEEVMVRRSCDSSTVTTPSTAFGSTSSGLYSDKEEESEEADIEEADRVLDGLSMEPEDWLKNPGASFSEMMLMKDKRAAAATALQNDINKEGSYTTEDSTDSKDSDDTLDGTDRHLKSVGGMTTIMIGDKEKQVASSKLSALISLLEKDRDSQTRSRSTRSSTIRSPSPTKEVKATQPEESQEAPEDVAAEDERDEVTNAKKPDVTGTSPANFSFLKGGVTIKMRSESQDRSSPLGRSHSTSTLNEIKLAHSKMFNNSSESLSPTVKTDKASSCSSEGESKEAEDSKAKYRRCSSLKSGKTPPGTPGRRKIVRFADVFGLDLADVKTFLDEIPKVPKSAFQDLKEAELSDLDSDSGSERTFPVQPPVGPPLPSGATGSTSSLASKAPTFSPLFNQPSGSSDFFNRLRDKKVSLESAYMSDLNTIKGIVRVVNLDFHKSVFARYTLDEWATTLDAPGAYMSGSCDGFSDKFTFAIDVSSIKGQVGKKVHFSICFCCSNNQYWDNNNNRNYTFQCFGAPVVRPTARPVTTASSAAFSKPRTSAMPAYRPPTHYQPATNAGLSQSPSTMGDDPWGRFL